MKQGIHPNYQQINVTCSCGANFQIGSTAEEDMNIEICSKCHPFFTGKQKLVDTAGRLDRFQKRMARFEEIQKQVVKSTKKAAKDEDNENQRDRSKAGNEEVLKKAKKAATKK